MGESSCVTVAETVLVAGLRRLCKAHHDAVRGSVSCPMRPFFRHSHAGAHVLSLRFCPSGIIDPRRSMEISEQASPARGAAAAGSLLRLVHSKSPDVLLGLLDHADLDEGCLVLLLRNPALPAEAIDRICREETFFSSYRVKAALAQHPRTPQHVSLRFLPHLYWRDQLQVSRDFRISMVLRRKAEHAIIERLPKLASGERVTLARLATTEILKVLVGEKDSRLLGACLENPRATEEIVIRLVYSEEVSPRFLLELSQMARWFTRYNVKLALARAAQSPVPLVLRVLPLLKLVDLKNLLLEKHQPEVVTEQAREIIRLKEQRA